MACVKAVKKEFRVRNFGFCDASPEDFCRFQWKWPGQPTTFLVYRIAVAVYQLLWNILVIAYWDDTRFYRPVDTTAKWPIYLSNWSFFILTVYFVTAAVCTVMHHIRKNRSKVTSSAPDSIRFELVETAAASSTPPLVEADQSPCQPLPWYFKLTWLLQSLASSAVLFVAMGYWFFEYDPKLEKLQVFTIHVHAVGTILALVDFMVVANPFRFLHAIYPMLYFTTYIIFSVIYYYAGGINPYGGREMYEGLIDWEDGVKESVVMSLVFIFLLGPVLHTMYLGLYLVRRLGAGEISCRNRCHGDPGSHLNGGDVAHEACIGEGKEEDKRTILRE